MRFAKALWEDKDKRTKSSKPFNTLAVSTDGTRAWRRRNYYHHRSIDQFSTALAVPTSSQVLVQ
jgi:hypothetical protein